MLFKLYNNVGEYLDIVKVVGKFNEKGNGDFDNFSNRINFGN